MNPETRLDYFNARYYSAEQGRFVSPDPGNAGADPSNPQTWNGYAYVTNAPLDYTDPSGLGFWSDVGAAIGAFFGIYGDSGLGLPSGIPGGGQDSGIWNEQVPISGSTAGDPLNLGGVFGGGSQGGGIFSLEPGETAITQTVRDAKLASGAIIDIVATIWGQVRNVGYHLKGLPTEPVAPNSQPFRLFGTYYCGPGGSGPTGGAVNGACKVHDDCYADARINAQGNMNWKIPWNSGQVAAAKACNQTLFDSVKGSDKAGATLLQWWLLEGDKIGWLRPGTTVHP